MSIGKKLTGAREKKKISLEQAYRHTRIHPDILKALEADEYENILSPTYIRSFLKEYASFLGLDVNKIIEEYNKPQKAGKPSPEPPSEKLQKLEIVKRLAKNATPVLKWLAIIVLAVVVLRGVFKFAQNIKQKQLAKQVKATQVKSQPATETTKKATVSKKLQAQQPPSKAVVIPRGEKLILAVDTTNDVWLRLKVDGKIIFENILKKGASESWKAEKDFTIWTGRAEALQLTLNGNYIGTAGKGVVKNLVIDRKGIR
ncbi:MAG: DUF4115 domain-containing protein [Candidatus Omnitrophota bacterium]|nr:MAG: DUF4115 domain-containing protein [Candidatus Omnitrophota bacterium]